MQLKLTKQMLIYVYFCLTLDFKKSICQWVLCNIKYVLLLREKQYKYCDEGRKHLGTNSKIFL